MVISRVCQFSRPFLNSRFQGTLTLQRSSTEFRSGAIKPKPEEMPFAWLGVLCAVVPGLLIGAAISKSVANFLEENDLFVPSDDDEDDD